MWWRKTGCIPTKEGLSHDRLLGGRVVCAPDLGAGVPVPTRDSRGSGVPGGLALRSYRGWGADRWGLWAWVCAGRLHGRMRGYLMSESTVVLNVTDPGNNLHGVPPCPGCGDRHRYPTWHAELERELTDVPPTWIPALLR